MKTTNPEVKRLAKIAFPHYLGRKFALEITDKPVTFDCAWGGGSRKR